MQAAFSQEELVREIVSKYLKKREPYDDILITVGVANRHVHLCCADLETLFGVGYKLHPMRELSQKGFYAAEETLVLAGPKGAIKRVRVLGPLRKETQIEVLASDGPVLGISPPLQASGTSTPSPALTLIGPKGSVIKNTGVMVAWRHIHVPPQEAADWGVKDGDLVQVKTAGDRGVTMNNVRIRVGEFNTELHIDLDEANAAGIKNGEYVEVLF